MRPDSLADLQRKRITTPKSLRRLLQKTMERAAEVSPRLWQDENSEKLSGKTAGGSGSGGVGVFAVLVLDVSTLYLSDNIAIPLHSGTSPPCD